MSRSTVAFEVIADLRRLAESRAHRAAGHVDKGSISAQAQSAADKYANLDTTAKQAVDKLQHEPSSITSADASEIMSKEHKAWGYRPEPGSISSTAQH